MMFNNPNTYTVFMLGKLPEQTLFQISSKKIAYRNQISFRRAIKGKLLSRCASLFCDPSITRLTFATIKLLNFRVAAQAYRRLRRARDWT